MSLTRPKRKASVNKNYVDTASESAFEQIISGVSSSSGSSVSKTVSTRGNGTSPSGPKALKKRPNAGLENPVVALANPIISPVVGKRPVSMAATETINAIPYNWQPPLFPGEEFSHKLDLTDATVNTVMQTLTCPRHPAAVPVQREELELKALQKMLVKNLGIEPEPWGTNLVLLRRLKQQSQSKTCLRIKKGDYIYMISEPPGEPYYIGRVKGFMRKSETQSPAEIEPAADYTFQIQWFYRPRDILKHTVDSRLLFASMHSDSCPLPSFRGLLTVLHKLDVETYFQPPKAPKTQPQQTPGHVPWASAVEFYSSFPNCFYFDKLYDRYILRFFDVVKTSTLLLHMANTANCSQNFILALNKRFEFVAMENARTKLFLNNFSLTLSTHCEICAEWCAQNDAVECAGCAKHFHMLCLDPPLLRKPSRGFSWSCALCTKQHELAYHSRKILMLSHDNRLTNEDEISAVSDIGLPPLFEAGQSISKRTHTPEGNHLPKYEQMAIEYLHKDAHVSVFERRLKEEWNMRYLGLHARLEEAVDLFDKAYYPRVSTSLGQRYQATNIPECDGHPIVYYDPDKTLQEKNKKKSSNGKKTVKKKVEVDMGKQLPVPAEYANTPPKEFPQWLQPRPKGYIERGVDDGTGETCTLMWKPADNDLSDRFRKLDAFVASQHHVAALLGLHPNSPNFVDGVLKAYMSSGGDIEKAAYAVSQFSRDTLKEPTFTKEEVRRFEAGVKKYGSELYPIYKDVKTQPASMVVRFYYIWKKTERGHIIWGAFPGRKKKPSKDVEMKINPVVDDYADSEDESAYENEKIVRKSRLFQCKHCKSYMSQKWFKITGFDGTTTHDNSAESDDLDPACVTALCFRCAKIWRRYAVYWEDPVEVERKTSRGTGGYRKKVESELVADAEKILYYARNENAAISFESFRWHPPSSVLGIMKPVKIRPSNGYRRTSGHFAQSAVHPEQHTAVAKALETPTKPVPTQATPRKLAAPKQVTPKESLRTVANTTLKRTASAFLVANGKLSVKAESPEEEIPEETVPKKRRVEAKVPHEPLKTERTRKRATPAGIEPATANARKMKPTPDAGLEDENHEMKEAPVEAVAMVVPPAKRPKKNADLTVLASPIFNVSYAGQVSEVVLHSRKDKRAFPPPTKETLERVLDEFKFRQLLDVWLLVQGWQAPQQARIELPFSATDRACAVCMEHDLSDESVQDTLICSHCGVNVHGTCAGISISGNTRPVRQWLCDACINDMSPKFSTDYACSICLAKSTNTELALLGNPHARPDYVMPIIETGKWCHVICALYCHAQISFRSVQAPSFVSKEIMGATPTKSLGCMVESVSKVFVENFDRQCGICERFNGGLVKCDMCPDLDQKAYHVTCAQDTLNFTLGFKVVPQKAAKSHTNTMTRGLIGKLAPVLVCPEHDHRQKETVLYIREQGKRSSTGEARPLVHLFIEDLMRQQDLRLTGPQLRAHNYIFMIETYMAKIGGRLNSGQKVVDHGDTTVSCCFCKIASSPKWWPLETVPASTSKDQETQEILENQQNLAEDKLDWRHDRAAKRRVACQKCHILGTSKEIESAHAEGDEFMLELSEPLTGDRYGVESPVDRISYTPYEQKNPALERSQITWADLLG